MIYKLNLMMMKMRIVVRRLEDIQSGLFLTLGMIMILILVKVRIRKRNC